MFLFRMFDTSRTVSLNKRADAHLPTTFVARCSDRFAVFFGCICADDNFRTNEHVHRSVTMVIVITKVQGHRRQCSFIGYGCTVTRCVFIPVRQWAAPSVHVAKVVGVTSSEVFKCLVCLQYMCTYWILEEVVEWS